MRVCCARGCARVLCAGVGVVHDRVRACAGVREGVWGHDESACASRRQKNGAYLWRVRRRPRPSSPPGPAHPTQARKRAMVSADTACQGHDSLASQWWVNRCTP